MKHQDEVDRSDTFDKIDQEQLKLNAAIAPAFVWGRLERAENQKIIDGGLADQMLAFRVMKHWEDGSRGRPE